MLDFINKRLEPKSNDVSTTPTVQQKVPTKKKKLTKENKQFLKYLKLLK